MARFGYLGLVYSKLWVDTVQDNSGVSWFYSSREKSGFLNLPPMLGNLKAPECDKYVFMFIV